MKEKRELLRSLFCHEGPERIAHCCSYVMSNLSKLLIVAVRVMGANRLSSSLKRANEQRAMRDLLLGIKKVKNCQNI